MSTPRSDCPYGAGACPKVTGMEESIRDLVMQMRRTNWYLAIVLGLLTCELGYVII